MGKGYAHAYSHTCTKYVIIPMLALSGFVGLTQGLAEDWLFALHSGPRRAFAPSEHLSSKVSIHNGTAYGLASARKKDFHKGPFSRVAAGSSRSMTSMALKAYELRLGP